MACCALITTSFLRHVYLVIRSWIWRRFCLDVSAETCSRTRGASIAHASVDRCSAPSTLFVCYRCASTARSARPSGVDGACAPLLCSICAMVGRMTGPMEPLTAIASKRIVNLFSLVPHGTPSTSPDVERFGSTVQGLEPTAFLLTTSIALHPSIDCRSHTRCDGSRGTHLPRRCRHQPASRASD